MKLFMHFSARRRLADGGDDAPFCRDKIATARFFAAQRLPLAAAQAAIVLAGDSGLEKMA